MIKKTLYVLLHILFLLSPSADLCAENTLTIGIHPYLPATELLEKFTPLADYLSKKVAHTIEIRISHNYEEHIDKMGNDRLDIAYMGPASYIKLVDRFGKKPILARLEINGKPNFQGMIITAKNSPVKSLSDLVGKRIVFGDPNSTMSHLVPRYVLDKSGIDVGMLENYTFMNNHHNVALGVLMGDFDAGAVKEETYNQYKGRGLRVLASTPRISEHIFITRKSLDPETVKVLKESLYGLKKSEEGRKVLTSIKSSVTGIVPADDADYNNLRLILRVLLEKGIMP